MPTSSAYVQLHIGGKVKVSIAAACAAWLHLVAVIGDEKIGFGKKSWWITGNAPLVCFVCLFFRLLTGKNISTEKDAVEVRVLIAPTFTLLPSSLLHSTL